MSRIVAFLNQKGGVGKTTLAVHIADALARNKQRVLLVDADPQGSALDWAAARHTEPLFPVAGFPKAAIHRELAPLSAGYDVVIIDGPPRVYDVAKGAIMASDVVLIPVQPSPYDVWAAKEIMDMYHEALIYKPGLRAAFVINRKIVNTALGRDVVDALSEYPIPVLQTAICQRVSFAESAAQGETVFETCPDTQGAKEMQQLANEIREFIA